MLPGDRPQPALWTILTPKWRGVLARLRQERQGSLSKPLMAIIVGSGFWAAVFGVAYRVLSYVQRVADIGDLLAGKMLATILLAFLSILLLSNIITALSTFFLAKDLDLLVAAPVGGTRLYLAKLGETVVHSSWMVALLALPILTAYGIVYSGGPLFPFVALAAFVPFLILPAVIGTIITVLLVNVFPARRTRELLGLLGLGALGVLVVFLRFMRPEQLARPEGFKNFVDYLVALKTPTSSLLPSEWTSGMIMNWLLRVSDPAPIARLWGAGAGRAGPGYTGPQTSVPAGILQGAGRGGAQGTPAASRRGRGRHDVAAHHQAGVPAQGHAALLPGQLPVEPADPAGGPDDDLPLQHQRPADPLGRADPLQPGDHHLVPQSRPRWIRAGRGGGAVHLSREYRSRVGRCGCSARARSIPRTMLWSKYWFGTLPLLVLAFVITVLTNSLLKVSPFMMAVSLGTILLYTLAVSALALSFGVFYPQFGTENAAQIPTSFGGVVYMMASLCLLALVIMIEAIPVTAHLRAHQRGEPFALTSELLLACGAVACILVAATLVPLRLSARRIEQMEF